MSELPEKVQNEWENRSGPVVLTTVDERGVPNAIYAGAVEKYDDSTIVVADNYFDKTRANILNGRNNKVSILFITEEGEAYQLKGKISYHREGEIYDKMKEWNSEDLPGIAAVALKVEEVYSGAEKLM